MNDYLLKKSGETLNKPSPENAAGIKISSLSIKNSNQLYNIITLSASIDLSDQTVFFSERENAIIKLICQEKSSKQIAFHLSMNQRTIERIRMRILQKMKVKSAAGIVIYALRNGLLTFQDLVNKSMSLLWFIGYLSE